MCVPSSHFFFFIEKQAMSSDLGFYDHYCSLDQLFVDPNFSCFISNNAVGAAANSS